MLSATDPNSVDPSAATAPPIRGGRRSASGLRADLIAGAVALAVVLAATAAIGWAHWYSPERIFAWAPPLFGRFRPHAGPGTLPAALIAALVLLRGPELAAGLRWRWLCALGYLTALGWTLALALVDGWQVGVVGQFTSGDQYLLDVPRVGAVGDFLPEFTAHVLAGRPDSWITQVSGHPPGALLVFVLLHRIGLSGGGWAGLTCALAGALAAVAVPSTVRALGAERGARACWPFAVLFPGANFLGSSADGLFAGVTASGVLLLALGAARLHRRETGAGAVAALGGGIVLGFGGFLSYGLVLLAPIALFVAVFPRNRGALVLGVLGAGTVVLAFALGGFWWWDGYRLVVQRYYQDLGSTRPYAYWVWANLGALVLSAGPLLGPGARRAVLDPLRRAAIRPVAGLVLAALLAIAVADLSGLSKAEVERIWLPFEVWLIPAAALLPPVSRRWWLGGQAVIALAVAHLVLTRW